VGAVRQGKFFELDLDGLDKSAAKSEVERIAKEVLTNPVIEEFSYRIEDRRSQPACELVPPFPAHSKSFHLLLNTLR